MKYFSIWVLAVVVVVVVEVVVIAESPRHIRGTLYHRTQQNRTQRVRNIAIGGYLLLTGLILPLPTLPIVAVQNDSKSSPKGPYSANYVYEPKDNRSDVARYYNRKAPKVCQNIGFGTVWHCLPVVLII